ncbi:GHKL domain-containing protein [Leptobacterium flavescens]|uniref:histidine kinase n=1 Tax=Leptobacterium flavescens TaxID=472055 RepID=A0A6P0UJ35_9FLAO|nr:HAMP domain-containing sensor histidine kinase [Leptobacterium flavescens]NER13315.1 GHKL domain-containing protein [Leptobacterium flavescens]
MSKRLFVLLVVLMSLSLVGIIFVQGYWIKTTIENKEEQFSMNVNQILKSTADKIEQKELKYFVDVVAENIDTLSNPNDTRIDQLFVIQTDSRTNEQFIYAHGILQEDYGIATTFFENANGLDSLNIPSRRILSTRESRIISDGFDIDRKKRKESQVVRSVGQLSDIQKALYETSFRDIAKRFPIHQRIDSKTIELLLQREFGDRGIDIDFEYGVYSNGLATKVRSNGFSSSKSTRYKTSLFIDNEGNSEYDLLVSFPKKNNFLISSIMGMVILSIIFTLVIIVAYSSAIYQLIRQKQISEIKTDFINNMTHEFKTPIATINLALDAIKNPKAFDDADKIKRYLGMIRDENKRMHAQVENVLRISKLEKNQLDISKDRVDVHDRIDEAVLHVSLIVENRGGYIRQHLDAPRSEILANEMHFTNVLVNILDNAIKYSPEAPEVDIYTEVVKNSIIIKIQDHGSGMSKAVLKRIFEKFYREHTGNIHNVKGHGLGLAYVKRIVEDHQGEVYAESEKDKGSIFYIKMPLI